MVSGSEVLYQKRLERAREILRSEVNPSKALDLVCEYILSYERWRRYQRYPFTMSELLELRACWGIYHK